MKIFIKMSLAIITCGLCMPAIAVKRFIVKYKPNQSQIAEKKIDSLLKDFGVQIVKSYPSTTGTHVIILNKDLDEKQTKQFIKNVEQDNSIEYIEEDGLEKPLSVPTPNAMHFPSSSQGKNFGNVH